LRVFVTKWFTRFARNEGISDRRLREAVERAEQGAIDADLGGNLVKQRLAREGGGRSGGYRTLIALQSARRSLFLYGFAKSERGNINTKKLAELKVLAKRFLGLTDVEIEKLLNAGEIRELDGHGQEQED